jgi:hypothetical protein
MHAHVADDAGTLDTDLTDELNAERLRPATRHQAVCDKGPSFITAALDQRTHTWTYSHGEAA